MPVEIRHADHSRFARSAYQCAARLPLVRFETPHERRRRKLRAAVQLIFIFAFGLLICSAFVLGKGF